MASETASSLQGVSLSYEFALEKDGDRLKAVVTKAGLDEAAKSLSEGFSAGLGFLIQGSELAEAAMGGAALGAGGIWAPFGSVSAGTDRIETGSHVDLSGVSARIGVARSFNAGSAHLAAGGFVEYGRGT